MEKHNNASFIGNTKPGSGLKSVAKQMGLPPSKEVQQEKNIHD